MLIGKRRAPRKKQEMIYLLFTAGGCNTMYSEGQLTF